MKTLIKSIICCQTVPLHRLLMYIVKIVCQASLPSFLTELSLTIFCLDKCQRKMAAVELHANATYYAQQHTALESFYGKGQLVIGGKLFSSCLAHCLLGIPKKVS